MVDKDGIKDRSSQWNLFTI